MRSSYPQSFIAFDFETANAARGSACAIGIAVFEKGRLIEQVERLIRPAPNCFDPYNTYIHGIIAEDVEDEPEFGELWPSLEPYFSHAFVAAHNVGFDLSVLRAVLTAAGMPFPELRYLCTVKLSKRTWFELSSFRLDAVAQHIGFRFKHHNALEDAVACGRIICRAMEVHAAETIEELAIKSGAGIGEMWSDGYITPRLPRAARKRKGPAAQAA